RRRCPHTRRAGLVPGGDRQPRGAGGGLRPAAGRTAYGQAVAAGRQRGGRGAGDRPPMTGAQGALVEHWSWRWSWIRLSATRPTGGAMTMARVDARGRGRDRRPACLGGGLECALVQADETARKVAEGRTAQSRGAA